jgi:hypothetical protein
MDAAAQLELKKYYSYTKYFCFVLVGLIFIYAVAVELIQWRYAPFGGFGTYQNRAFVAKMMRYSLLLVSAFELGVVMIMRKYLKHLVTKKVGLFVIVGGSPPVRLFGFYNIAFAIFNSVAIYGLILFLITAKGVDFYLFMVISLGFSYIFFPKYEQWEQLLESGSND